MDLIDRPLDNYDFITFAVGLAMLVALVALVLFIMGLPGRVAISRNHPHAESVKVMGWMGFLAVVPWVHAFMWAFHSSMTIDVRRFPNEEKEAIREEIARLKGEPPTSPDAAPSDSKTT